MAAGAYPSRFEPVGPRWLLRPRKRRVRLLLPYESHLEVRRAHRLKAQLLRRHRPSGKLRGSWGAAFLPSGSWLDCSRAIARDDARQQCSMTAGSSSSKKRKTRARRRFLHRGRHEGRFFLPVARELLAEEAEATFEVAARWVLRVDRDEGSRELGHFVVARGDSFS